MSKNKVQFQKGYSIVDFIKDYGTEEQCRHAMFRWRWPDGFLAVGQAVIRPSRPVACTNAQSAITRLL